MPRILLFRHGRTDYNAAGRFQGQLDTSLDELGRAQAAALGKFIAGELAAAEAATAEAAAASAGLRGKIRLFSSPLGRAKNTLQAVADACRLAHLPICELPGLAEINHGEWNGRLAADVDAAALAAWRQRPHEGTAGPGGESLAQLQARGMAALEQIAHELAADEIAFVAAHDAVIRVILLGILAAPLSSFNALEQHNCAVNVIDFSTSAASGAAGGGTGALQSHCAGFRLIAANLSAHSGNGLFSRFFQAAL